MLTAGATHVAQAQQASTVPDTVTLATGDTFQKAWVADPRDRARQFAYQVAKQLPALEFYEKTHEMPAETVAAKIGGSSNKAAAMDWVNANRAWGPMAITGLALGIGKPPVTADTMVQFVQLQAQMVQAQNNAIDKGRFDFAWAAKGRGTTGNAVVDEEFANLDRLNRTVATDKAGFGQSVLTAGVPQTDARAKLDLVEATALDFGMQTGAVPLRLSGNLSAAQNPKAFAALKDFKADAGFIQRRETYLDDLASLNRDNTTQIQNGANSLSPAQAKAQVSLFQQERAKIESDVREAQGYVRDQQAQGKFGGSQPQKQGALQQLLPAKAGGPVQRKYG